MALFDKPCLVDIDTQDDFVRPGGALYFPGADEPIPIWKQLTDFGQSYRLPMIATMDCHTPEDPEFAQFPPHCVIGTGGQQKISETLAVQHQLIQADQVDATIDFESQVIVEKSTINIFEKSQAAVVFGAVQCSAFVVYGVATEYCVKTAVLGLRERGYRVYVVSDAIRAFDPAAGERALAEMANAGAGFIQSATFFDKAHQQITARGQ